MRSMLKKAMCVAAGTLALAATAAADDAVIGEGRAPLGSGNSAAIRGVAKQMRDARVASEETIGNEFVTRVEVTVDRKQIRNAIRGTELDKLSDRSFSILMLVDEFITSARDLNLPLEELTGMKYDAGSSFRDKSIRAASSKSSSSAAVGYSASVDAVAGASSRMSGSQTDASGTRSGQGGATAAAALSTRKNYAAAGSSKSSRSAIDARNVASSSHETASYKKLVKYQDTSKPTSKPLFLNEFAGKLRDYDLRLLDSLNAKSKFFGDKPISLAT